MRAPAAGIGRATLYKYFPDVESILSAWHEPRIGAHLHALTAAGGLRSEAAAEITLAGLRPPGA